MTKEQWVELYCRVYSAYEYAGLKDETSRAALGEILDHLGYMRPAIIDQQFTNS